MNHRAVLIFFCRLDKLPITIYTRFDQTLKCDSAYQLFEMLTNLLETSEISWHQNVEIYLISQLAFQFLNPPFKFRRLQHVGVDQCGTYLVPEESSGRLEEFHLQSPTEPCVTVSRHTAPVSLSLGASRPQADAGRESSSPFRLAKYSL